MIYQSNAANLSSESEGDWRAESLEEILRSRTFSRAEQLRNFLRYVCEMEIAGKGQEISEYTIAVVALGRPSEFIAADDGIVRNRAHGLRQKLLEYYAEENPEADVRIELPKGSYAPRFIRTQPDVPQPVQTTGIRYFVKGFLCAVALCVVAAGVLHIVQAPRRPDSVLMEAWGPLAQPAANALIVLGMPSQLILRTFPLGSHPNANLDLLPPPALAAYYAARQPIPPGDDLHLMTTTAIRIGEVQGAVATIRTLDSLGASFEVLQDRETTLPSMRARNLFLFGDPNLVPTVAKYMEKSAFTIEYNESVHDFVIRERHPKAGISGIFSTGPKVRNTLVDIPGLLTVLPNEDSSQGRKKSVIFSCANSAGCQAAAEFFSSPRCLRDLQERFRKEGIKGFPRAYQVVVRAKADGLMLLSFIYETHRVLDPSVE